MKVLISNGFKALRRGEFVTASPSSNEFVLTEESDHPLATLKEIATANRVTFRGDIKKAAELLTILLTHFGEIDMPEQNTPSPEVTAKPLIVDGLKAGKNDDQIRAEILMATGKSWPAVKKLFNDIIASENLRIDPKDREKSVTTILNKHKFKAYEDWDKVQEHIDRIVKEVEDTDSVMALKLVRKHAKSKEIKLPKKPRTGGGAQPYRTRVLSHIVANPSITEAELRAWVAEQKAKAKNLDKLQDAAVVFLTFARQYYSAVDDAQAADDTQKAA